jgi:hypothetical protein
MTNCTIWAFTLFGIPFVPPFSSDLIVRMIDPGIKQEPGYSVYDECVTQKLAILASKDAIEPALGTVWPGPCVFPDFTLPETDLVRFTFPFYCYFIFISALFIFYSQFDLYVSHSLVFFFFFQFRFAEFLVVAISVQEVYD